MGGAKKRVACQAVRLATSVRGPSSDTQGANDLERGRKHEETAHAAGPNAKTLRDVPLLKLSLSFLTPHPVKTAPLCADEGRGFGPWGVRVDLNPVG